MSCKKVYSQKALLFAERLRTFLFPAKFQVHLKCSLSRPEIAKGSNWLYSILVQCHAKRFIQKRFDILPKDRKFVLLATERSLYEYEQSDQSKRMGGVLKKFASLMLSPLSHPSQRKGVTRWMWLALAQTFSNNTCLLLLRVSARLCVWPIRTLRHPPDNPLVYPIPLNIRLMLHFKLVPLYRLVGLSARDRSSWSLVRFFLSLPV